MLTISVGLLYSAVSSKSWKGNAKKLNPDFVSPIISKFFDVGSEFDDSNTRMSNLTISFSKCKIGVAFNPNSESTKRSPQSCLYNGDEEKGEHKQWQIPVTGHLQDI